MAALPHPTLKPWTRPAIARLLVVDDLEEIREGVASLLLEAGFATVDAAADGAQALTLLRLARYQLIITDWRMPVLDGLGLLLALRAAPAQRPTPVLVMSGSRTAVAALEAGANAVLAKPFTSDQLLGAVAGVLSQPLRPRL